MALAGLLAGCQTEPAKTTVAKADFIGSARCATCHVQEYMSWQGTLYANMVRPRDWLLARGNRRMDMLAQQRAPHLNKECLLQRMHGRSHSGESRTLHTHSFEPMFRCGWPDAVDRSSFLLSNRTAGTLRGFARAYFRAYIGGFRGAFSRAFS